MMQGSPEYFIGGNWITLEKNGPALYTMCPVTVSYNTAAECVLGYSQDKFQKLDWG